MADLQASSWNEADASNNSGSPAGWADSALPSTVKAVGRMMMGALKRFWNLNNPVYTTGGTSTVITIAPSVAISAYATGLTIDCILGHDIGANATLNASSLGAKNVYVQTQAGLRQTLANDARQTNRVRFSYDASLNSSAGGWVMRNIPLPGGTSGYVLTANGANAEPTFQALPAQATQAPPVRQTVLAASVDSGGLPNFISVGTGLTVNIAATSVPIILTAANGFGATGSVDRIGQIAADTTIGSLANNTTNYLYADIASDGTVTLGSTTLPPVYEWGGTPSTTSGQFTFNIQQMTGYVGNGSTAPQAYRVFIGEAVTSGGSVTSVRNYALMGRYRVGAQTVTLGATLTVSHNLGVIPYRMLPSYLVNISTELNYSVGDRVQFGTGGAFVNSSGAAFLIDKNTISANVTSAIYLPDKSTHADTGIAAAKWNWEFQVERGW